MLGMVVLQSFHIFPFFWFWSVLAFWWWFRFDKGYLDSLQWRYQGHSSTNPIWHPRSAYWIPRIIWVQRSMSFVRCLLQIENTKAMVQCPRPDIYLDITCLLHTKNLLQFKCPDKTDWMKLGEVTSYTVAYYVILCHSRIARAWFNAQHLPEYKCHWLSW